MDKLKILTYPNPLLAQKAEQVTHFDDELKDLVKKMFELMYTEEGVGLAASQVGILKRFAVIDISPTRTEPLVLINPEITERSGSVTCNEGCLSIPDYRETVKRDKEITVVAQDLEGAQFELKADDLLSRCIQHEMDHMDGVLFVDRVSALKKQIFRKWRKKHVFVEADVEESDE
ncbi:MAG: peptide deformylase [Bdellovibrionota bacterium]|jgi:peptide deformylase